MRGGILVRLLNSGGQTFILIFIGFLCRSYGIFSEKDMGGINKFLTKISLPAVFFFSLATLNWSTVSYKLLVSLCLAKTIVYALTSIITYFAIGRNDPNRAGISGLYAIFTTKSNDIAMGVPIVTAIWGKEYANYLYLFSPYQLLVINLIGFVQMEGSLQNREMMQGEEDQSTVSSRAFQVLKRVMLTPIVLSCILGFVVNQIAGPSSLPGFFFELFETLSITYSGAALFALGLSIQSRLKAGQSTLITSLVATKVILLPLIMALVTHLITKNDTNTQFSFLYGMLPTAPTVYIFAVNYNLKETLMSSACLVCLMASLPMLLISGIALQIHGDKDQRESATIGLQIARCTTGASLGGAFVVIVLALLARHKRKISGCWRVFVMLATATFGVAFMKMVCISETTHLSANNAVVARIVETFFTFLQRSYGVVLAIVLHTRLKGSSFLLLKVERLGHVCVWTGCIVISILHGAVPIFRPTYEDIGYSDPDYDQMMLACSTVQPTAFLIIRLILHTGLAIASLVLVFRFQTEIARRCKIVYGNKLSISDGGDEKLSLTMSLHNGVPPDLSTPEKSEPLLQHVDSKNRAGDFKSTASSELGSQVGSQVAVYDVDAEVKEACKDSTRYTVLIVYNSAGLVLAVMMTIGSIVREDQHVSGFAQVIDVLDYIFHLSLGLLMFFIFVGHADIRWGAGRAYMSIVRCCPCIESVRSWIKGEFQLPEEMPGPNIYRPQPPSRCYSDHASVATRQATAQTEGVTFIGARTRVVNGSEVVAARSMPVTGYLPRRPTIGRKLGSLLQ